jgi:hypothetical protein
MIADQQTGKNSGPGLVDYRNGASAIPLFCIFWPNFFFLKNISRRNSQKIVVDTDTDTDTAE